MESKLSLVNGANGHLGNNLVRLLLDKGINVRATARNIKNKEIFKGLDCEVVESDLMDKNSLIKALQGVDTFYAVAAVFKLWAKDQQKEIYEINLKGTQNAIEAAVEAGVKKIVFVSSIAALNFSSNPIKESDGNNPNRQNVYFNSKNDSELLAFELAKKNGIELVSVLPSSMIGSNAFRELTPSYNLLKLILKKQIPIDTEMTFNWVDVKDVAEGCYLAATKGKNGERYILANEKCMTIRETVIITQQLLPEMKIKLPIIVPKSVLYIVAYLMEVGSKLTGKAPLLTVNNIDVYFGLQQNFDISKSKKELGFNPKPPTQAVEEALKYLQDNKERLLN
ncbi:NAD-dependent epimerase/dehydratase family protein [Flavobacterium sp. H122]|uniref:NAD-dependent epimerase/dehydratase family protein n=1 Tax=Flavobacterium sp. H122 TaxID=2529860 RepID=UPI0020BF2C0D|nr:NAD-dependent epimerase/dehydratase family protein [Flavobacterium sp. H122]